MKRIIRTILCCFLSISAMAQQDDEKTLFLISDTHLDTQWNWDVKTTINEYVKNTLVDNMKLMDKYPSFMLNYESAIKYRWMKEYYPAEYAKLQQYIDRGQWHPSGMSVDANDVMVSSAENILRNWLYGHQFFKEEFGVRGGEDIMLPDCFGFGYTLPSLAKHAGFKGFHSQKLSWGCAVYDQLPRFGRWQGVDGSIIYAIHKPGAYDAHEEFNCDITESSNVIQRINDNKQKLGIPMDVRYVGPRSDRGGALQDNASKEGENTPYWLNFSAQKKDGSVNVVLATPDSIFRYLASHGGEKLPLWNNELPMKEHGVGSYTSKGALKRWNRKNELTADAAEKSSSVAAWLGARPYPQAVLNEAWFRTLWQNHHDGITGTSIHKADEYSYNEYYLANKSFAAELATSIGAVAQHLDTQVEGTPVVVYNPLSWQRQDVVECALPMAEQPEGIAVFGPDGKEVLAQMTKYENGTLHFIFAADVPSLGYAVYDVRPGKACTLSSSLAADVDNRRISNGRYRIGLSTAGDLMGLYDEKNSRTLISSAVKTQFLQDEELVWEAWEINYADVVRSPKATLGGTPEIVLVEDGPLRKSFRVMRQKDGSTFLQYIRMNALSDRVDCVNEVDWQTQQRLLKVQFPFFFSNASDTYDLSLGTIQRGIRSESLWEVIGHQWADHSSTNGSYGVSILTDCKYGWDKPSDKYLRLTLHHTPYARDHKHHADMDLGPNLYTYSLFPHEGSWGTATQREASCLNQPLVAFSAPRHAGSLGRTLTFAQPNSDEVSIKALKKAEETDELIVRVFEWAGKDKDEVRIHFPQAITSAREVNAIEESLPLARGGLVDGCDLVFPIGHYQPKTFAVRLAAAEKVEPGKQTDTPVDLPYNVDLMSYDSSINNGSSTYTYLYPAEQIPDEVVADGVTFRMGDRTNGKYNALRCSSQSITLPARTKEQNKLYLLLASCNATGTTARVTIGTETTDLAIPYFTGLAGQPLTTTNLQSSYIRQPIGLLATHAHNYSSKKNEIMQCMYMYKVCVDLPEEATAFSISGTKLMLFSATVSDNKMDDVKPLQELETIIDYQELNVPSAVDGRLKPSSVKASHQNNTSEAGSMANDMDIKTKWCVTSSQSQTPYLEYTFRDSVVIDRWLALHAASETVEYVTKEFKFQYLNPEGNWVDVEYIKDNQSNKTFRSLDKPIRTKKVRLQIVQGAQNEFVTRIYEFAVYGHLASEETAIEGPEAVSDDAPTLYYGIDGTQRKEPQRGINLVKQGGKTIKIIH